MIGRISIKYGLSMIRVLITINLYTWIPIYWKITISELDSIITPCNHQPAVSRSAQLLVI